MFRFFENLVDPYADYPQDDTPPTRLWPFLWGYLKSFKYVFWAAGIMSFIVAAIEIWLIAYMGRLVDLIAPGGEANMWREHGWEFVLIGIFLLTFRPLLQVISVALMNQTILPNVGTLVRWRAHRHVLRQSVGWFENDFAGRIANRIMQTPPAAGEVAFQIFDAVTFAVAYIVGAAILLADGDPMLMVPMVIWIVLYSGLLRWTVKRVGPASQASSDARSEVTGRIVDSYTNIHSVKMFAQDDREITYAKDAIENARLTFIQEMRLFTVMDVCLVLLNGFLIVSVVGWGLYLWVNGLTTAGIVAAAAALTLRLNAMTGWIMWAVTSLFRELGVVSEGMETIAQPVTLVDDQKAVDLVVFEGEVVVDNLTHHYGRASGGIDGIDLVIPAGQKVGLVGRSGAGKSTLVKLLLRFYDVENGQIRIDNQSIANVRQDSLRRNIGMVQQDSSLLHRSVRENILYGNPTATEDQMIAAAKQAEAYDFILELEDGQGRKGFDAQVGERGVKLSGGQRQRISLARVILKDAPILLLDEATSALDSEVEAVIQETLYGLMEGKTVIAIAHRLSTIAQMDRIVVMDGGKIVEEGTHTDLLALNGQYAGFWARQSGGFLDTDMDKEITE